jgi:hypothetical protein
MRCSFRRHMVQSCGALLTCHEILGQHVRPKEVTMFLGSTSPCATSTLLYLSGSNESDRDLRHYLAEQGFHLQVVHTAQQIANQLLCAPEADAVLIRTDHIDTGSMIACSFKFICPQMPIILLSAQHPQGDQLPPGVDALFYGNLGNDDAVPHIASAIRQLTAAPIHAEEVFAGAANAYLN